MKANERADYLAALEELTEDLDDLMADLEDVRDDAQDALDETGDPAVSAIVKRMDSALDLLAQAVSLLEGSEE